MVVAGAMAAGLLLRHFHGSSGASQAGPLGFVMHSQAKQLDNVPFVTGDGASVQLADLKGKVLLLNIWATWCPPCRKEMPSLDRLQAKLGGSDFEVVALSIDTDAKGLASVKTFYTQVGIRHLRIFQDPTGTAGFKLGTVGVPTTLLIDRQGRELGRLTGTAEWDGGEALALVRGAMAAGRAAP
ncbi:MAG: TlpA family protein disulfide reductase [Burkholderiales bacterium]|nr:TlpA family protein disulfide reductase [Burkholderiales bacterium]